MRSQRAVASLALIAGLMVTIVGEGSSAPAPQTRRWHIGVAGSYSNGYRGLLGRCGLPRERMSEWKLDDPNYLKQFDVAIIGYPMTKASRTSTAVEAFVRAGGIAVTGLNVAPSTSALPGKRMNERRGPNMAFVPSDCPVSEGLPAIGHIACNRRPGRAIIPAADRPDTYILARFTDTGAHSSVRGTLRHGSQGAPAMILFRCGEGWWLWCGTMMSMWTSLRGSQFEPAIINTLSFVTDGELVSRWDMSAISPDDLLTSRDEADTGARKRSGRGEPVAPPEDFEIWDDDLDLAGDFDMTGVLPHGGEAEVLTSYWSPEWQRVIRFEPDAVRIIRVEGDRETEIAAVALDSLEGETHQVAIKRRHGHVFVRIDGRPWCSAIDGPEQKGVVASRGLEDACCQPAGPVEFNDEFMRYADERSAWEPLTGRWSVQQDKGDRDAGKASTSTNPFRYEAHSPAEGEGVAVVGSWFWDDYHAEVSVRPTCEFVGMVAHHEVPGSCIALRIPVRKERDEPGKIALVLMRNGEEQTIATAPGACRWDQWAKVGLRVSGGYIEGLIDGRVVVRGLDALRATGGAGLLVSGGEAIFDDVRIGPWVALPRPFGEDALADWLPERGACEVAPGPAPAVLVRGRPTARIVSSWVGGRAYRCWATVCPHGGGEAGLYVRYLGPRRYYMISLTPEGASRTRVALKRSNHDDERLLGERILEGGRGIERLITAAVVDDHIEVWVDDEKLFDLMDEGPRAGRIGMYVGDEGAAVFRDIGALPVERERRLVDDLAPSFAGMIDRHTWSGKANFLVADPDDMRLFRHRGEYAGDVAVKVGVRLQKGEPITVASFCLDDGRNPKSGYELRITRVWDEREMKLEAFRLGESVAEGVASLPSTRSEFVAEMARTNGSLVLRINGDPALIYHDAAPLDARRVGMKLAGSLLHPDDTRVQTTNVRVYTFGQAATDWITECGTWEVASRWSCSPGWTWFAGWDEKDAWTTNKHVFTGDQRMDMFVGAKMLDVPGQKRKQEVLRDIRLALCATPGDTQSGYRFSLGGKENKWSSIQKDGKTVAQAKWSVPQGGLHNDWTLVSAIKRGNVVSLVWEGHEVVRYEDPEPLLRGHVAMGTYDNGLLIPKVTIYGRVQDPAVRAPSDAAEGRAVIEMRG